MHGETSWRESTRQNTPFPETTTGSLALKIDSGWWFQTFSIFAPSWGNDPIWLIFFKWVETTTYNFVRRCILVFFPGLFSGAFAVSFREGKSLINYLWSNYLAWFLKHQQHWVQLSNEKDPDCLGFTGGYTTQLCWDYNKPLSGSLLTNQYYGKEEFFFCGSTCFA